jgi:hypothetical protein
MGVCEKWRNQISETFKMAADVKWTVVTCRQTFMFKRHKKSQSAKSNIENL